LPKLKQVLDILQMKIINDKQLVEMQINFHQKEKISVQLFNIDGIQHDELLQLEQVN
jgi:hypothetical protein